MIRAILMAAGRGTRISREVNDYCKCTLDIGGKPLIRHTVEMLLESGIEPHLVVGYDKRRIFKALEGLPVIFHENVFFSITNSLASLWFARDALLGDKLLLGNADVFWENNLLSVLLEETRDCVMLSDSSRVEIGDYLFHVEKEKVLHYGKTTDCEKANCEYVGLAMIQSDLLPAFRNRLEQLIESQQCHRWWEDVLYSMIPERPIWSKDIAGHFWAEIDYIEDYKRILKYRGVRYD